MSERDWTKATDDELSDAVDDGDDPMAAIEAWRRETEDLRTQRDAALLRAETAEEELAKEQIRRDIADRLLVASRARAETAVGLLRRWINGTATLAETDAFLSSTPGTAAPATGKCEVCGGVGIYRARPSTRPPTTVKCRACNGTGRAGTARSAGTAAEACDQCGAKREPWQDVQEKRCPNHASPYASCDGTLRGTAGEDDHG